MPRDRRVKPIQELLNPNCVPGINAGELVDGRDDRIMIPRTARGSPGVPEGRKPVIEESFESRLLPIGLRQDAAADEFHHLRHCHGALLV